MSTSEIESANIDLKTTNKLNGWWRLWVVFSIIWLLIVSVFSAFAWHDEGYEKDIAKHYIVLEKLNSSEIDKLETNTDFISKNLSQEIELPNGARINFKIPFKKEEMEKWCDNYCIKGMEAQIKERTKFIGYYFLAAITLPSITAIIGLCVKWISNGFK